MWRIIAYFIKEYIVSFITWHVSICALDFSPSVCVSVCVQACLSVCVCVCVCACVLLCERERIRECLVVFLCTFLCVCVCFCKRVIQSVPFVCMCMCVWGECVYLRECECMRECMCLWVVKPHCIICWVHFIYIFFLSTRIPSSNLSNSSKEEKKGLIKSRKKQF